MATSSLKDLAKTCITILYSSRSIIESNPGRKLAFCTTPLDYYSSNNNGDWRKYICNKSNFSKLKHKYGNNLSECDSHYRLVIPKEAYMCESLIPKFKENYNDFEMVLMSWKRNGITPIHDHSEFGCIFGVLNGTLLERKYFNGKSKADCQNTILVEGDIAYIDNSVGTHRIYNVTEEYDDDEFKYTLIQNSIDTNSMSLHIYSPPGYYESSHKNETG